MTDCITSTERPCVHVSDQDTAYLDLRDELQPEETVQTVNVVDESSVLNIPNAGPNTTELQLFNATIPVGKAAEWQYSNVPQTPGVYTFRVTILTSQSRQKTYRCKLDMVP